jgi:hypothetical protein
MLRISSVHSKILMVKLGLTADRISAITFHSNQPQDWGRARSEGKTVNSRRKFAIMIPVLTCGTTTCSNALLLSQAIHWSGLIYWIQSHSKSVSRSHQGPAWSDSWLSWLPCPEQFDCEATLLRSFHSFGGSGLHLNCWPDVRTEKNFERGEVWGDGDSSFWWFLQQIIESDLKLSELGQRCNGAYPGADQKMSALMGGSN